MRARHAALLVLVVLFAIAVAGCAGMRLHAPDRVTSTEDIPYIADDNPKHRLDLYVPRWGTNFPIVLFVHGGFWQNQDRRYYQSVVGIYGNVGTALAKRGIAVAVQSYRLSPGVGIQDQLSDVLAALRWVEDHGAEHGADPRKLVLAGYSAGGHLVSLLGLDSRYMIAAGLDPKQVRGIVSLSGILDVPAMGAQQDAAFNRETTFPLFGVAPAQQALLSPSSYVRADAPPMLLLAAEHDYPFVREAGKSTAQRLQALGAQATFREVLGYDHADMVTSIHTSDDRESDLVAAFVREVTTR